MMMGLIIFIHVVICILLMVIILIQPGKSGGLTEGMASAESIFGAKTNVFMIKTTTAMAAVFFVTCLSLVIFSSQKSKSLMADKRPVPLTAPEVQEPQPQEPQTLENSQPQEPEVPNAAPVTEPQPEPLPVQ